MKHSFYEKYIKRLLDLIIGLLVILLLWPLMIIVAIFIKLDSPGPVFFFQERIGKDGKVFRMMKFRSMQTNSEHTGDGVYCKQGDTRVTRIGRILRATSIDELPQAWNMVSGNMSLIGPRPPLTYHPWPYDQYTDEQKRMFEVRPGLTGWAQINGRKQVEWNERIKLNIYYVDNCSFLLDLKIFFKTIYIVLSNRNNSNTTNTATK